ncbi:MucR family transcriptional regulator [Panacagrimonas sp.]|uniref:MucR family transcriptional regulator n=1 Tax=Panacagrimonas sp. TaxID=2480088 RepID=UPI003B5228CE
MRKATTRPSRSSPFQSREEVAAYTSGGDIECLECGQRLQYLAPHLKHAHEITCAEYRAKWAIPAGVALAGTLLRASHRQNIISLNRAGVTVCSDLRAAADAGRAAPRQPRVEWDIQECTQRAVEVGKARGLPPREQWASNKAKRAAYSLAHYHLKRGNPEPMREFREQWGTPERKQQ